MKSKLETTALPISQDPMKEVKSTGGMTRDEAMAMRLERIEILYKKVHELTDGNTDLIPSIFKEALPYYFQL